MGAMIGLDHLSYVAAGIVVVGSVAFLFTDSGGLLVHDLSAHVDGDVLVISGVLENVGDSDIDEIIIGRIEVSDLVIDQRRVYPEGSDSGYPVLRLYGDGGVRHYCSSVCDVDVVGHSSGAVSGYSGFSLANGAVSGASSSFLGVGEEVLFVLSLPGSSAGDGIIPDHVFGELLMVLQYDGNRSVSGSVMVG